MKRERFSAPALRQPSVLALAGLDPSGRAGLLADLASIRELRSHGFGVATVLTAQGRSTFAVAAVPRSILRAQLRALREGHRFSAIKLGAVPDRGTLRDILGELKGANAYWVIDPVTRTSAGHRLSELRAGDYLALSGEKRILTPNLAEAGWLLGLAPPRSVSQAAEAGQELVHRGFAVVVVKAGHRPSDATDVVCEPSGVHLLRGPKLKRDRARHRGTGCRFASAMAAALARGCNAVDAARQAKACVARYLAT